MKEYKNKTEIPVPDEKDKKIFISCNVTGYDGFDKSKKSKSNSLEYFVQSPVVVDSNQVQIATAEDKINSNVPEEEKLYDGAGRDISYLPKNHPFRKYIENKKGKFSSEPVRILSVGDTGGKHHVPIPIYDYQTKKIVGYRDSTTGKITNIATKPSVPLYIKDGVAVFKDSTGKIIYDNNFDPNTLPPKPVDKPKREYTLDLYVKDILTDSLISDAIITYDNNTTTTDRFGNSKFTVELDKKNSFKLIIDEPKYYSKIINSFVISNDEKYVAYLIPKSFDLEYYDQVARSVVGYSRIWKNKPNVVISIDLPMEVKNNISKALSSSGFNCNYSVGSIDSYLNNSNYILYTFDSTINHGGLTKMTPVNNGYNTLVILNSVHPYVIHHETAHVIYGSGGLHTNKNSILNESLPNLKSFTELDLQGFKVHSRMINGSRSPDINSHK